VASSEHLSLNEAQLFRNRSRNDRSCSRKSGIELANIFTIRYQGFVEHPSLLRIHLQGQGEERGPSSYAEDKSLVVVDVLVHGSGHFRVTSAPGTTPPFKSCTVPPMLPAITSWLGASSASPDSVPTNRIAITNSFNITLLRVFYGKCEMRNRAFNLQPILRGSA